tara:strand:+ start:828 stop:1358 length:531 start_codon:yes stop_codon:yes gene_type:complete
MACNISSGRKVPCKSAVGGIKTIYLADYGTLGDATIVGGEITLLSGTPDFFQFDVKGASSLETAINSSRENGTTFYESTLTMALTFQDKATQEQLKLITHARPHVAIEDYNGNFFLIGLDHGAEVTGGSITSGAAMGDASGYNLTIVAQETAPPYFITGSVITAAASAVQIDPTGI